MALFIKRFLTWAWLATLIVAGVVHAAAPRTLLVVGDSLSAAYGLDTRSGWVALLGTRLHENGLDYKVLNASISGDTTANGRARLRPLLDQHRPAVVVIALGGNDGLRGLALDDMRRNLNAMVTLAQTAGAKVLLVGVPLPPNYGRPYIVKFHRVYLEVARARGVPLVDSILDGVGADRDLMQVDGIHPTAAAQPRLLDNVWVLLRRLL